MEWIMQKQEQQTQQTLTTCNTFDMKSQTRECCRSHKNNIKGNFWFEFWGQALDSVATMETYCDRPGAITGF